MVRLSEVGQFLRRPHDAFKVPWLVPNLSVSNVDTENVESEQCLFYVSFGGGQTDERDE